MNIPSLVFLAKWSKKGSVAPIFIVAFARTVHPGLEDGKSVVQSRTGVGTFRSYSVGYSQANSLLNERV